LRDEFAKILIHRTQAGQLRTGKPKQAPMGLGDRALNGGQLTERLIVAVYAIGFLPIHHHNISASGGLCDKICSLLLRARATDHRKRKAPRWEGDITGKTLIVPSGIERNMWLND
jgi:hypothetical protein